MPKRSNDFQRLVYLAKSHWVDAQSIAESEFLTDSETGAQREVDVCITGIVAGHSVVVAIECTSTKRKADITWVEQLKAKHDRLPTNVLVLYSRNGFTADAKEFSTLHGIETIELEQVEHGYVTELMGRCKNLVTVLYKLDIEKVLLTVPEETDLPLENVAASSENYVYYSDGAYAMSVRELVEGFLGTREVVAELCKRGTEEHVAFVIEKRDVLDLNGKEVYLEKIEPRLLRKIASLRVQGSCKFYISKFPMEHGKLGEIEVSWGTSEIGGRDAMIVVSPDESGGPKISVSIKSKKKTKKRT